jgi:hypothetical protein
MEALLEFIYHGEVSVDPDNLPSLLQAAQCLSIQGLAPGALHPDVITILIYPLISIAKIYPVCT